MSDFEAGKCGLLFKRGCPGVFLMCGKDDVVCKWCKRILELEADVAWDDERLAHYRGLISRLEADLSALRKQTRWRGMELEADLEGVQVENIELGADLSAMRKNYARLEQSHIQLEEENNALREQLRWRNVREEKPEDGQECEAWWGAHGRVVLSVWYSNLQRFGLAGIEWWRPKSEGPEGE